jgi:hypothetical protein
MRNNEMKLTKQQLKQIVEEEMTSLAIKELSLPKPDFVKDKENIKMKTCLAKASGHPAAVCDDPKMLKKALAHIAAGGATETTDDAAAAQKELEEAVAGATKLTKQKLRKILKEELVKIIAEITGFEPPIADAEMEVMKHYQALLDALEDSGRAEWAEVLLKLRPELEHDLDVEARGDEDVFTNAPKDYASMEEHKLTKQQLKQVVREELTGVLGEKKDGGFVKAAKEIEKKGTEGEFTEYCGGKVTDACIEKGLKAGGKRAKQAAFAKAARTVAKDNK